MGNVVSINLDAMQAMLTGLGTSQQRVDNLRVNLNKHISSAQSHVKKAPVPMVSTSDLVRVWWWLEEQKVPISRRLELARVVAGSNPSIHRVDMDESWLDALSVSTIPGDVTAISRTMADGDMGAIQAILDAHMVTITDVYGTEVPFYDPVFGKLLAQRISPVELANYLDGINQAGEHINATKYDQLLRGFGGFLSSGARVMNPQDLDAFTAKWAAVVPIVPDSSPTASPGPSTDENVLSDFAYTALPVQLLSLVIARGQWPDSFLTGMWDAITAQEGDDGSAYWAASNHRVWDPGVPDPATGGYAVIADPAWGIWNAAVSNPEWIIRTFGSGGTKTLSVHDHSHDGEMVPTEAPSLDRPTQDVYTALYDLFKRGSADSATASALITALSLTDAFTISTGGQATLTPQIQPIIDDISAIHNLSDATHMLLDMASMLPIIGDIADLASSLIYFFEGDSFNGWLCLAGVLLPSALGLAVMVPRWMRKARAIADVVDEAPVIIRAGERLADIPVDAFTRMTTQLHARTINGLQERTAEIYRNLDELGPMSRTKRKDFLYDNLTPAYSTVYNPRNGKYYTAVNNPEGKAPKTSDLMPPLGDRIEHMDDETKNAISEHEGGLGSHAEVWAVNEALKDDPDALEYLIVDTRRTGIDPKHPMGEEFVACPHCRAILQGATIISG